jgi:hypothetical protein
MERCALYEGHEIRPRPYHLKAGGWTTDVDIMRDHGSYIASVRLSARNTWDSEEEAIRQGFCFAVAAIDGKVPGCDVNDL